MTKPIVHAGFWGGLPFPSFSKPVYICHDGYHEEHFKQHSQHCFKVFIQGCEPVQAFYNSHPKFNFNVLEQFDLILYHEKCFALGKNNQIFPFGTCRISKKFIKTSANFEVSFLCGSKNYLPGHTLRHNIYKNLGEIKNLGVKAFYTFPPGTSGDCVSKDYIFESSQYSIVIENHRNENYFSEKLIDCLVTETIPFYWGCTNINDYFDKSGIIKFEDASDLINKIKLITPDLYSSRKEVIKKNKELALQYAGDFDNSPTFYVERVAKEINKFL